MYAEEKKPMTVSGSGAAVKTGEIENGKKVQKGQGIESPEAKKAAAKSEEAPADLSPAKDFSAKAGKPAKKVTGESTQMKKSFMDLYDEAMVVTEAEAPAVEDPQAWDDSQGDFAGTPGGEPGGEPGAEEAGVGGSEGELYAQLADIFSQLAEIKGAGVAGAEGEEGAPEAGAEELPPPTGESVVAEMKSEPEPKEFPGEISKLQLPRSLAGKGVEKKEPKKAASKGNDKDKTGKLEDAPAGFHHDKGMMKVKGDGPIHKGGNASFVETN
jgi:hypothetical protein